MHKYILLILPALVGLETGLLVGQTCPDKLISTDPSAPVSEAGSIAQPNPFNWLDMDYDIYSQYQVNPTIQSPFYHTSNLDLDHLVESKDMRPEDGWELIRYKTGKDAAGNNMSTQADFVYMVLYNKYTGIMRVMAAGDPMGNHNGAQLLVKFGTSQYTPSMYSHISEIHEVETFTASNLESSSVMRYKEGSSKWFYADFPLAYDPCVCLYESKMVVQISLIDSAFINLSGDIDGVLSDMSDPASGEVKENGYAFKDIAGLPIKAQKSYKTINSFVQKQEKALKIEGKTNAELKAAELKKRNDLNKLQKGLKSSRFLLEGFKIAPYVGGAMTIVDFFISGAKESTGPQEVKLSPVAMNANIKLQGNINAPYYFDDIIFYTPGSLGANNRSEMEEYPFYNEVLGTVNLMTKPDIFYDRSPVLTYFIDNGSGQSPTPFSYRYYRFQLDETSIKLLLNPSADVSIQDLYGEIVFEGLHQRTVGLPSPQFKFPAISANMTSTEDFSMEDTVYASRVMPLACMEDLTIGLELLGANPLQFDDIEAYLKLYVNLNRDDATGTTQNVLFVGKFPASLVDKTSDPSATWSTTYDFQPKITLDASSAAISSDVYAWEVVEIKSGTIFQLGSGGINIIAGEEIIIDPGVEIPTGVELTIGDPTQCSQSISPVGHTEIQSFCQSSAYQSPARQPRQASTDQTKDRTPLHLIAQPNPFQEQSYLSFSLPEDGVVSLGVYDLTGQKVKNLLLSQYLKKGNHELSISFHALPAGLYTAILQTDHARETLKLVKQ